MGDRETADRNNHEPDSNPHQPLSSAATLPTFDPEQPHSNDIHTETNPNPQESERWFRAPDWWMVILTALTVAVAGITLRVFWKQFKEMQTQTGLLNAQAQQAAQDSVEASQKVEEQLRLTARQAKSAEDSVKAIQRQMRQDQRA